MIHRPKLLTALVAALSLASGVAVAQEEPKPEEIEIEAPAEGGEAPAEADASGTDTEAAAPGAAKPAPELHLGEAQASWQDVVVVKRKPFLKNSRTELVPSWGVTLNDNMIRHYQFDAQLNYYLTDVLAVGAEAAYFVKDLLEPYELIATEYRRLPTLNQYNFGAALNFHYVPIYAKFAVMNRHIIHWEALFTAGVGFTQSEVLPRDPALPGWTNFLITPDVGFTTRVFLNDWITLNLGVKDYIFNDKFENVGRTADQTLAQAKDDAEGKLINHIVFQAGLSLWFPTSFRYTTFR